MIVNNPVMFFDICQEVFLANVNDNCPLEDYNKETQKWSRYENNDDLGIHLKDKPQRKYCTHGTL